MEIDEKLIEKITSAVLQEIRKVQQVKPTEERPIIKGYKEIGTAVQGRDVTEVVIGIGPCFGKDIRHTLSGLDHVDVIKELLAGIEEEGMKARIVRIMKTSDVAFIGKEAAMLSGSGISIGIQSKGTTLIHQRDLYPLTNLELFPQAPLITLKLYRDIGKNAARYAKGIPVKPIPVQNDFMSRPKFQVKAAIMHIKETEKVIKNGKPIQIEREDIL